MKEHSNVHWCLKHLHCGENKKLSSCVHGEHKLILSSSQNCFTRSHGAALLTPFSSCHCFARLVTALVSQCIFLLPKSSMSHYPSKTSILSLINYVCLKFVSSSEPPLMFKACRKGALQWCLSSSCLKQVKPPYNAITNYWLYSRVHL